MHKIKLFTIFVFLLITSLGYSLTHTPISHNISTSWEESDPSKTETTDKSSFDYQFPIAVYAIAAVTGVSLLVLGVACKVKLWNKLKPRRWSTQGQVDSPPLPSAPALFSDPETGHKPPSQSHAGKPVQGILVLSPSQTMERVHVLLLDVPQMLERERSGLSRIEDATFSQYVARICENYEQISRAGNLEPGSSLDGFKLTLSTAYDELIFFMNRKYLQGGPSQGLREFLSKLLEIHKVIPFLSDLQLEELEWSLD